MGFVRWVVDRQLKRLLQKKTSPAYDADTDSNEAIADYIKNAVPQPPTANSLHDILHKNGSYTYDNTTDSLEAIRDYSVVGNICTTTAGTIIQDGATGAPNSVNVTGHSSADTFGSWTALDASTASIVWISHIICQMNAADQYCIEIGTGGGPTTIIRFSFQCVANDILALPISPPIKVAASTAISARVATHGGGFDVANIGLSYYIGLET